MNCCRLCGREEEKYRLKCIFEKENLIENVHRFLQIQIFEEDPLSHEVCETCEDTVKTIVHYVTECQNMQRQLHKLSNSENSKEPEDTIKLENEPVNFHETGIKCELFDDDPQSSLFEDDTENPVLCVGGSSAINYSSLNVPSTSSRVPNNSTHNDLINCDNSNDEILSELQNLPPSSVENFQEETHWKTEEFDHSERNNNDIILPTMIPQDAHAPFPSSMTENIASNSNDLEKTPSPTKLNDSKKFIPSTRGNPRLIEDGHMYYCDRKVEDKVTYWKCQYARKLRCRARVTTVGNEITSRSKSHNHLGDAAKIELAKIKNDIKTASRSSMVAPQTVIAQCLKNASQSAVTSLPKVRHIIRSIQNARAQQCSYPPLPKERRNISLPFDTKKTSKGDNFVLYDSGPDDDNRIMVFGTLNNLKILSECTHWFTDGTFPVSPHLFHQLFTIHGLFEENEETLALVYALLPNNNETTYLHLLNKLKGLEPSLNPELVIVDFEKAAVNAFEKVFPTATLQGSFFHFSQAIMRHVCTSGFKAKYEKEVEFALRVRHLLALAFLPTAKVKEVFENHLNGGSFYSSEFQRKVLAYFEDTWIGHGACSSATFALELWNCRNSVLHHLLKTNNVVERWHRNFSNMLQCLHPHIFKLIEGLAKEQVHTELKYEQLLGGKQPTKRYRKYEDSLMRLEDKVAQYNENGDLLEYLRGVAQNILC